VSQSQKLLIVDDEDVVCQSCIRILSPHDFETEAYTDPHKGLRQAIENDYDAILVDIKMPQMDGIEFLRALRRVKPDVPVLIMTGYASVGNAAEAVRLRASDFVTKPFTPDEMLSAVRKMIQKAAEGKPGPDSVWTAAGHEPAAGRRLLGERRLHVVVCVKMVPDTTQVKIDPVTNTLIRKDVPFITNPFDTRAVEEALRVKDRYEAHVTAISMGPPTAEAVLRRAISLGADDAVLLSDMAFGGADTLATSKVLAEAIRRLDQHRPVDLIICGQQTIDGDTAQVGPGIACRLGMSQLTLVEEISKIDQKARVLCVRRRLEQHREVVEAALPAMVTVVREINVPRYPTVPGRLHAADAPLPTWTNNVLKMEPDKIGLRGSPTQVKKIFAPQRSKGEVVQGEGEQQEQAVRRVLERLVNWDVVRLHDES
jgi:electron transfer flavoprotein beta subunit